MTTEPRLDLASCATPQEMRARCDAWMEWRSGGSKPQRSATRRADGSRVTNSRTVAATLAWRRWSDGFAARSLDAVNAWQKQEGIAAGAGRPSPRWTDSRKPVTISHGDDVLFESGPGGALRRVAAPSHASGPRAVAPPVSQITAGERHRRSEAAKARHRARLRAAAAPARASSTRQARTMTDAEMLRTGGYHILR